MEQGDIEVRLATATDQESIFAMMKEYYREEGYPIVPMTASSALAELLSDPGLGRVLVAEQPGRAVGYLALTLGFSLEYGGRDAFVDELFVRPAHRRRGLGARLLELAATTCSALGVRALHLEVERRNEIGQRLYRRQSFTDNDRLLLTRRLVS